MSDQIGHDRTWYVYRMYDVGGCLLYAGSTTSVPRRTAEHRPSAWFRHVSRVEVDEYQGRWRAALAERAAGPGRHGGLRGGIGKSLAASMCDEELTEAMSHAAYAKETNEALSRAWGVSIHKVRQLRPPESDPLARPRRA
ncbi:hypothetical protein ACJ6WD_10035 [Streptomyces sp. VTCC 41912]|uniref:hypothetical protein n=1 Tax=Streptomyces sp. VTCC 41912 TaxID=3383243 RepID=UPI003896D987